MDRLVLGSRSNYEGMLMSTGEGLTWEAHGFRVLRKIGAIGPLVEIVIFGTPERLANDEIVEDEARAVAAAAALNMVPELRGYLGEADQIAADRKLQGRAATIIQGVLGDDGGVAWNEQPGGGDGAGEIWSGGDRLGFFYPQISPAERRAILRTAEILQVARASRPFDREAIRRLVDAIYAEA